MVPLAQAMSTGSAEPGRRAPRTSRVVGAGSAMRGPPRRSSVPPERDQRGDAGQWTLRPSQAVAGGRTVVPPPAMALTVGEFCRHPVVGRGDPVVLAGQPALDRAVRWVHSSDIYEMGPLLRDGDLLLTTGLGLGPHDAEGRREFVRQVARSGAAGVVLELCRYFTAAPEEMVAEADELGLPLVGLRAVVPFVEVTQAVNEALVDGAVRRLREADEISRGLSSALAAGRDLPALLGELGRRLGRPVTLTTADGTVLRGAGR